MWLLCGSYWLTFKIFLPLRKQQEVTSMFPTIFLVGYHQCFKELYQFRSNFINIVFFHIRLMTPIKKQ